MAIANVEYVISGEGKKKAVLIPWNEYQELIEDLHDLRVIAERKEEEAMSLEEFKKRLKRDGLLS